MVEQDENTIQQTGAELMEFGFGTSDITPRVGVELYGYGAYLNRHSTGLRQRLSANAMAARSGEKTVVLVSCDLVGLSDHIVASVREMVAQETGIPRGAVCVHCTHTHSGPATKQGIGQGEQDRPYLETLPRRIAAACIEAAGDLRSGQIRHATVPCVGIGYNRERESRPALQEALSEDWRPQLPDITDTAAEVFTVRREGRVAGFLSYFSCHPVVGGADNTWIHGDFVAVATQMLVRQMPGSTGLFVQGCSGNINSCAVHHSFQDSLLALDVLASRYARQVRPGIHNGEQSATEDVAFAVDQCDLSHRPLGRERIEQLLGDRERILQDPGRSDADPELRRATVDAVALRRELKRQERSGLDYEDTVEVQTLRIGPLVLVGAPFEICHRYKRTVQDAFEQPVLVAGLCNGAHGYLPEREAFDEEDNYAAQTVPYLLGYPPFAPSVEDEMTSAMISLTGGLID